MDLVRRLQERLDLKKIVIMDGGTGTEIARRGITIHGARSWTANANLAVPDLVRDIHEEYIHAGAEIIITNTFSTSRTTLAIDGLDEQTEEINKQSVKLAMDARNNCAGGESVAIAGSMSAFEPKGSPEVTPSYEHALKDYREQVQILAEAGVDLIILEMFSRTIDLKAAVVAASETGLPIWVGLSCENFEGELYLGLMGRHARETISDAVDACASPNVKAFCIMHSPPEVTAEALRELRYRTSLPLGAYAHGGRIADQLGQAPEVSSGGQFGDVDEIILRKTESNAANSRTDPAKYLEYAREWVESGATIIGGCCGTTPEHIKALSASNLRNMGA